MASPPQTEGDSLLIKDLSIGVPAFKTVLPLPIPVPIPLRVHRWLFGDESSMQGKELVSNVTARCRPGEILAIIGGSGSGKSTLLTAIVGRLANLPVTSGSISYQSPNARVAGTQARTPHQMKDRIGFVPQNDYLLPYLTVRETVTYAAEFRLPSTVTRAERAEVVDRVLSDLSLMSVAETLVGGSGSMLKGISGGERRRLSIACVLVARPSVLVLDEPTTGLDSTTAFQVLMVLKGLAEGGCAPGSADSQQRHGRRLTIIVSIHQPRSDAFQLFDRLLLLSKGKVVYSGLARRSLDWFRMIGERWPAGRESEHGKNPLECPMGTNPLDFLIDISSVDMRRGSSHSSASSTAGKVQGADGEADEIRSVKDEQLEEGKTVAGEKTEKQAIDAALANAEEEEERNRERVEMLVEAWRVGGKAEEIFGLQPEGDEVATPTSVPAAPASADVEPRRPSYFSQTRTLCSRAFKNTQRNHAQMIGLGAQAIGIGLLVGGSFYRLGESPSDIQSLKTLCFQHIVTYFYLTLVYSVYRYCSSELVIFDRERADHLYHVLPWLFAEIISNFPLNFVSTALYSLIVYFMTNMRGGSTTSEAAGYVFMIIAECVLVQLGTISFALIGASVVRVYATASLVANGTSIFFLLTAGYVLVHPPVYVDWVKYISVYYHGFRIAVVSQFKDRSFICDGIQGLARNQCEGNQVLAGLGVPKDDSLAIYYGGLIGIFLVFNAIACIILVIYKPGGVRHAAQVESRHAGKYSPSDSEMDIARERVDVDIRGLGLRWTKRTWFGLGPQVEKEILHDINFRCPAGEITAILGPSGAGKSSLLQLLASRAMHAGSMAQFRPSGSIMFNGQARGRNTSELLAYVEQEDDYHLPALTVRETLRYAAILRLPHAMSRKRKLARAEELIRMLGLRPCADRLVGGPLVKGISGGEKRRLSLAVQMMNDPPVLIVDEVTSGLDASTAANVMAVLQAIARSGRTVIVTLHQPRSDIYEMLDNLVVLARGGHLAYAGPRTSVEPSFALQGFNLPAQFNPADFILDLITVTSRDPASADRVRGIVDHWQHVGAKQLELADDKPVEKNAVTPVGHVWACRLTPIWIAGPVVLDRMVRNLWRQQPVFWVRLQQTPLLGCLFLLFYQRLSNGPSGGQDRIGLIQEVVTSMSFVGLLNCIAIFPSDRDLFLHEYRSSAAYATGTFLLSFTLVEIPWQFLSSVLFAIVINIGSGMRTNARIFFEFATIIWSLQSSGESIGIVFACITTDTGLSVSLVSTFLTILCLFSGIISVSVPSWLSDIAWATSMKSGSHLMVINEANGLQLNCPVETLASGECLVQNGEQLLSIFAWNDGLGTETLLGIMIACTVGYRLVSWVALMWKVGGW